VPVQADPWPGVPVRRRNALERADACWVPIAPGLTPHGLRHSYKTLMIEPGTLATLMDAQMGHADGSVRLATRTLPRA
jgi:integrase